MGKLLESLPGDPSNPSPLNIQISEFTLIIGTPTLQQEPQRDEEESQGTRVGLSGVLINSPGRPERLTTTTRGSNRSGGRFLPWEEV